MPQSRDPDPLVPTLHVVEQELEERLKEACTRGQVSDETTGELMRLEEALLDAARVAKQAVSVRRRLRTRAEAAEGATPDGSASDREPGARAAPSAHTPDDCTMRNFVDAQGSSGRRGR